MAILRIKEVRELSGAAVDQKIEELHLELNTERGTVASGGKAANAGRIKELRRTIARILTVQNEAARKLGTKKTQKDARKQGAKKTQNTNARKLRVKNAESAKEKY